MMDNKMNENALLPVTPKLQNNPKVKLHAQICEYLNDLYARKNHDYGDSFHQTFVEEGMAMARIRLGDKFGRFKTLSKGEEKIAGKSSAQTSSQFYGSGDGKLYGSGDGRHTYQQVNDESIKDTLLDLANYAIMTVLEMELQKNPGGAHRGNL